MILVYHATYTYCINTYVYTHWTTNSVSVLIYKCAHQRAKYNLNKLTIVGEKEFRLTDFTSFFECDGFQPFLKTSFYGCESTDPCSNHSYRLSGHLFTYIYKSLRSRILVFDASRRITFERFPKMSNFVFFCQPKIIRSRKATVNVLQFSVHVGNAPPKKEERKKRPIKFDYRLMGKPQKSSSCYYASAHI